MSSPGRGLVLAGSLGLLFFSQQPRAFAAASIGASQFHNEVEPILSQFCFDCHGDGAKKGGIAFDQFKSDQELLESRELWLKALKNLRAGIMPPPNKPQPAAEQKSVIENWIKRASFRADPLNPDPGRVTVRRLNRAEYRNTIRDLLGVDYNTQLEFPPDDTGYGFDNIADVLTLPPMLLEKYVTAAKSIVAQAVPSSSGVSPEKIISGRQFQLPGEHAAPSDKPAIGGLPLSYYVPVLVTNAFTAHNAGRYQLSLDLVVLEKFVDNVFDYNKCRILFRVDGKELLRKDYSWEGGKPYHYELNQDWATGDHLLAFELQPLTPGEKQTRTLSLQINSVSVRGPLDKAYLVRPANYEKFFPKPVPENSNDRLSYARELLADFSRRAFRRPVDDKTVSRLASLAQSVYRQPGKTFEEGVSQAMVAVLASPRFLFLEEPPEPLSASASYSNIDEFALASRLSYFLWSSMPDEELFRMAANKQLRANLPAQVNRMLADKRSSAFVRDFTGQWLQARDVESVAIEPRPILAREEKFDPEAIRIRKRFRELNERSDDQLSAAEKDELRQIRMNFQASSRRPSRFNLTSELRRSMRLETEKVFEYVMKEDRSLLELIDSNYTFLNERLAKHYGITNVVGDDFRRVALPEDSPRGGILGEAGILMVTSNPTRTSPVKRGLFILDNVLGTPPPPPPPNIPPLEDAAKGLTNHPPSLRETLALHRESPLCASCHNRMDPLGLALENFNALGMWREREYDQMIDPAGKLITGEEFKNFKTLKHILATQHSLDFYRTLTQKMLTYALGRGLEYYDVETVDQIVNRIVKADGHPSALMMGIVESSPFQKTRGTSSTQTRSQMSAVEQHADAITTK